MDATGIAIAGWAINSVALWVDESIDRRIGRAGTQRAGHGRLRLRRTEPEPVTAAVPYVPAPFCLRSERIRHRATA